MWNIKKSTVRFFALLAAALLLAACSSQSSEYPETEEYIIIEDAGANIRDMIFECSEDEPNDADQPDCETAKEIYREVLQSNAEFFMRGRFHDAHEGYYTTLSELLDSFTEFDRPAYEATQFVILWVEDSEIPAVIVEIKITAASPGNRIVLHYQNGRVYGYHVSFSDMRNIQETGRAYFFEEHEPASWYTFIHETIAADFTSAWGNYFERVKQYEQAASSQSSEDPDAERDWRVIESGDHFRVVQIYESPSWYRRYEMFSNSGEVVFSHSTSGNTRISNVGESVLEFRQGAGTFAWWGQFYHIEDDLLSEAFNNHFHLRDSLIGYLHWLDDEWKVVVRDAFDIERFYMEFVFTLDELRPVPAGTTLEYLGENQLKVTYLSSDGVSFDENVILLLCY